MATMERVTAGLLLAATALTGCGGGASEGEGSASLEDLQNMILAGGVFRVQVRLADYKLDTGFGEMQMDATWQSRAYFDPQRGEGAFCEDRTITTFQAQDVMKKLQENNGADTGHLCGFDAANPPRVTRVDARTLRLSAPCQQGEGEVVVEYTRLGDASRFGQGEWTFQANGDVYPALAASEGACAWMADSRARFTPAVQYEGLDLASDTRRITWTLIAPYGGGHAALELTFAQTPTAGEYTVANVSEGDAPPSGQVGVRLTGDAFGGEVIGSEGTVTLTRQGNGLLTGRFDFTAASGEATFQGTFDVTL